MAKLSLTHNNRRRKLRFSRNDSLLVTPQPESQLKRDKRQWYMEHFTKFMFRTFGTNEQNGLDYLINLPLLPWNYCCTSIKFGEWYYFNDSDHKWISLGDRDVFRRFWGENWDDINKFSRNDLKYIFYQDKFESKLDGNPYLIGFKNGVYDLKGGQFRGGQREDYISTGTGFDYIEFKKDNKKHIEQLLEVNSFMTKLFPDSETREYMYYIMSGFLTCRCDTGKLYIFLGPGSNGKSSLINLLNMSFGQYARRLPVSLLARRRAGHSATPELAQVSGSRLVSMEEPDHNDTLNTAALKELTGNDQISVRPLYHEPREFKPTFELTLCCNSLPKLPRDAYGDAATWRRIRIVRFDSKFVSAPKTNMEYQVDLFLADKMYNWKEAFIWILIRYFHKYQALGPPKEPDTVIQATKKYRDSSNIDTNNLFNKFVQECNITTPVNSIKLRSLYQKFKNWYKNNYPDQLRYMPNIRKFKKEVLF